MTPPRDLDSWLDGEVDADGDREELLARVLVRLADGDDIDVSDPEERSRLRSVLESELSSDPDPIEIEGELDGVQSDVDGVRTELEAVRADVDGLQSDLDGLQSDFDGLQSDLDGLQSDLDGLQSDLDGLQSELDQSIDDVRERVVQVLREAESKAPKDHSHPGLASRVDRLRTDIEGLNDRIAELDRRIADDVDGLTDDIDDVSEKLTRVATVVVRDRRRIADLETEHARRDAVADLREVANRHGVRKANCENCGETVHIGLLSAPQCPHCTVQFDAVEPGSGFFSSNRLLVGDHPALEAATEEPSAASEILEE